MSPSRISRVIAIAGLKAPRYKFSAATCSAATCSAATCSAATCSAALLGPRLPVARQHVIGQGEERVALGASRKRVEVRLGAIGELDGPAVGVIDRRVLAQAAAQVVPLLLRDGTRVDDLADDPCAFAALVLALQMDQRQRDLALAQVAANRLADGFLVARVVQQIVHQL